MFVVTALAVERRKSLLQAKPMPPTAEEISRMTVQDVMARWPATVQLFQQLHIVCPGCPISPFCTVQDAAVLHRLESLSLSVYQLVSQLTERLTD